MKSQTILTAVVTAVLVMASSVYADDISVTVYNSNLGVVRETRTLDFEKGFGKVSFTDVPTMIDATSVGFEPVDKTKNVAILEQNYAYDLVSPDKIYSKYIDKDIEVFNKEGNVFSGTLLSHSGGSLVLKDDHEKIEIIRMDQVVNVNFPELPEGLITRPTLFWLYQSGFSGSAECNVSYQTSGLNWSAEYVGILSDNEKDLGLNGWSSITNNSGATFKDATLKLIAGDIHRAMPQPMRTKSLDRESIQMVAGAGFEEKEFFEYHLYTLPRKATIANNEIKQIALFDPAATKVEKEYYFEPQKHASNVSVVVKFQNSVSDGLGIPLPAGRVRLFKADTDGSMILLGEDKINHTPKDEEVKLTVGNAFDITAKEKVLSYDKISSHVEERIYEITLKNHKKEDISVIVEKRLWGDWTVKDTSHEYNKIDANTIRFNIPVKSDGQSVVTFTAQTTR